MGRQKLRYLTHITCFPISGSDCATKTGEENLQTILHGFYLFSFSVCTVVLVVLYSLIAHVIGKYHKTHQPFKRALHIAKAQDYISTSSTSKSGKGAIPNVEDHGWSAGALESRVYVIANNQDQSSSSMSCNSDGSRTAVCQGHTSTTNKSGNVWIDEDQNTQAANDSRTLKRKRNKKYKETVAAMKTTLMLFTIAIIYIAGFVPYHTVKIWQHQAALAEVETMGVQFALRSYLLNSVINPFIYGFFNVKFR